MQEGNNENDGEDEDKEYEIAECKESKGSKVQNDGIIMSFRSCNIKKCINQTCVNQGLPALIRM